MEFEALEAWQISQKQADSPPSFAAEMQTQDTLGARVPSQSVATCQREVAFAWAKLLGEFHGKYLDTVENVHSNGNHDVRWMYLLRTIALLEGKRSNLPGFPDNISLQAQAR